MHSVYIKLANLVLTVYSSVVFGVERQKLLQEANSVPKLDILFMSR